LILAVESETGDDHELPLAVEVEADAFRAEPQAQAQRLLEPHERDAVFAEDRVQPLRSDRQHVGEPGEARFIVLRRQDRTIGRRRIDRSTEIAPRADARRHRNNRVLEGFVMLVHRGSYAPFHAAHRCCCTAWN